MVNQSQVAIGSCQCIKTAFCNFQNNSTHISGNIFIKTTKCYFLLRTTAKLELEIYQRPQPLKGFLATKLLFCRISLFFFGFYTTCAKSAIISV